MSDLISRQAAIDALFKILDRPNHAEFVYADEIYKVLNALPSVEPKQHGRWVESWGGKWHSCSICGGIPPFNMMGDDMPTPYCPHCGATMDLDEVEE